ncbi:ATP-binding protein [Meiothermus sp. CFH 77666]|uniref:ATP-binding response regulator n=1 Tax=Meiothermus sp. CFH 77666 TaxID=2817942 RepID=UPI001AA078F9|nr:ATP-binding protein [Meiothermus sp. CFH 77666]MBO1438779.1 response regulator [Meiothermus sp. CFH 77666]
MSVLDLLDECIQLSRPMAEGRGIKFVLNNTSDFKTPVLADRQRLKQVFLNLLSNAIRYNREGGKVTLDCSPLPESFRINIRDTGFGIAPEMMSRLFTPFDRLGVQNVEGTGLGLALSKRLIEAMGGRLGVDSVVNQGSNFWVELPKAQMSMPMLEQSSVDAGVPGSLSTNRFSVLYIEDNLSNLRLVEHILMRFGNPEVITTMQGSLGLELAREHRPNLILLDLHLPDMQGKDVLLRLKSDARTRDIPVVILSADASPQQIEYLLAQGASAYITKPLEVSYLLDVLNKTLS